MASSTRTLIMELDTFTVVIPCYNVEKYIKETINSVINQTRAADEVILINDGSTDDTIIKIENVISRLDKSSKKKFNILNSSNKGPGSARNLGIRKAKSKWICFLDSDDTWTANKLEIVEKYILKNRDKNFFCHNEYVNYKNKISKNLYSNMFKPHKNLTKQLFKRNIFSTSAITCDKDLLINFGLFNEELMSAQDYELWLRLSNYMKPLFIREILGTYNMRKGNITSGSVYFRMKNEYRIALMHREKINLIGFVFRIFRITVVYTFNFIKKIFKLNF